MKLRELVKICINKISEDIVKGFKIDGKNEDLRYYTDIFDVNDFIQQKKFLILGYKGTGKTYFAKKIQHIKEEEGNKVVNCNMEKFYTTLRKLEKKRIKDIRRELDMIWRFIVYIEIFKIVKNEKLNSEDRDIIRTINKFLNKNSFLLDLSSDKILKKIIDEEIEVNTNFGVGIKKKIDMLFGKKTKESSKKTVLKAEYFDFLDSLEEKIRNLLNNLGYGISIFFDELDSKFTNTKNNRDILLSLIEESSRINMEYDNFNIFICLRTEIFNLLNSSDLNKILEDKSVTFKWNEEFLLKMLKKRLETSKMKDENFFYFYFGNKNIQIKTRKKLKKIPVLSYILHRTRYRPRDIIAFFKYLLKQDSSIPITKERMDKESGYSNYLYNEVINELVGFYSNEVILIRFQMIEKFNKSTFRINEFFKEFKITNEKKDYLDFFQKLYDLNIINYIKNKNDHQKKFFNYNIDGSHILEETHLIAINYGLRRQLKLYDPADEKNVL